MTTVRRVVTPLLFGVLLLVLWQVVVDVRQIPGYLLPSPSAIGEQLRDNVSDVLGAARTSGLNALVGLVAGVVLAVLAAVVAVWVPVLRWLLTPLAAAVSAMPIVALAPVLSIMFSATSDLPRRIVVAIVAFFPVFVTTARGLTRIDPVHADLLRSYATGGWAATRVLRLPGAVPYLFTGIRVAASLAVISAVVAEYFGGLQNGLGSRITSAASNTAYARAWAYVVAAIALGLVFYLISLAVERLATRGRPAV
jgi:NitT/TauT family transport system permease protein